MVLLGRTDETTTFIETLLNQSDTLQEKWFIPLTSFTVGKGNLLHRGGLKLEPGTHLLAQKLTVGQKHAVLCPKDTGQMASSDLAMSWLNTVTSFI